MAEMALAAFATSAGTGAAAAATSAIGPVTAAASGLGTLTSGAGLMSLASSGMSLLSGIGTIGGALGMVSGGMQQAGTAKMQAAQSDLNARAERVRAEDTAIQLRKGLIANISSANAIFASRGIGIGSGTPEQAKAEAARNAGANIDKARFGGDFNAANAEGQASVYRADGKAAKTSGLASAGLTLGGSKSLRSLLDF